jgi:hypothetical protein
MTTPVAVKTVDLPLPGYPMLTRVLSSSFFNAVPTRETLAGRVRQLYETMSRSTPEQSVALLANVLREAYQSAPGESVQWVVSRPHPLVPEMNIVRMFANEDSSVEVYSVSQDGNTPMRNRIPASCVRLVEEAMPLEVFIEELRAAESDGGDSDGDDDEDTFDEGADSGEPEPGGDLPASTNAAMSTNGRAVS